MNRIHILQPLEWDSNFFKKDIARIDLFDVAESASQINHLIRESPFDLIYCFAEENLGAQEKIVTLIEGATWVDGKITYLKSIQKQENFESSSIQSTDKMEEKLFDLAIQTGVYSRFHTDQMFEEKLYIDLYKKWIENSINRTIAREVAIWREHDRIEGMVTIGEKNGRADIGLIGVDASARGKGIATQLIKYAENFAILNGYNELQVVTQLQNEPACCLYEKSGFKKESLVNIFHIWK